MHDPCIFLYKNKKMKTKEEQKDRHDEE